MGEAVDIYHHNAEERRKNRLAYESATRSSKYVAEHCYYSTMGGGNVLFMRGRNHDPDEVTVAKVFADSGYNVLMTPENGGIWISKRNRFGRLKYADGILNGRKYEQRTIAGEIENPVQKVNNILNHCLDKGVRIAVGYDKSNQLSRESVRQGIEKFTSYPRNARSIDCLFIISADKKLYRHDIKNP